MWLQYGLFQQGDNLIHTTQSLEAAILEMERELGLRPSRHLLGPYSRHHSRRRRRRRALNTADNGMNLENATSSSSSSLIASPPPGGSSSVPSKPPSHPKSVDALDDPDQPEGLRHSSYRQDAKVIACTRSIDPDMLQGACD